VKTGDTKVLRVSGAQIYTLTLGSTSSTALISPSTPIPTSNPSPSSASSADTGISKGAIAGIVTGVLGCLGLVLLVVILLRRRRSHDIQEKNEATYNEASEAYNEAF
jgi:TRAP-type C4-dicarboxylate transport system permease large subunit